MSEPGIWIEIEHGSPVEQPLDMLGTDLRHVHTTYGPPLLVRQAFDALSLNSVIVFMKKDPDKVLSGYDTAYGRVMALYPPGEKYPYGWIKVSPIGPTREQRAVERIGGVMRPPGWVIRAMSAREIEDLLPPKETATEAAETPCTACTDDEGPCTCTQACGSILCRFWPPQEATLVQHRLAPGNFVLSPDARLLCPVPTCTWETEPLRGQMLLRIEELARNHLNTERYDTEHTYWAGRISWVSALKPETE